MRAYKFYFLVMLAMFTGNLNDASSQYSREWLKIRPTSTPYTPLQFGVNPVAVDGNGFVYRTASIINPTTTIDYVTTKYDSLGNQVWVSYYNSLGSGFDEPTAIAVSQTGNVYVTGGGAGDVSFDYATVKYNSSGVQQWVARYDTHGLDDIASAIAVDDSENVYITGYFTGSGIVTIKYNSSGDSLWVLRQDSLGTADMAYDIEINSFGNIIVAGISGSDLLIMSYTPSGTLRWKYRYNGPGNGPDEFPHLVTDDSGNSFIGASSKGTGGLDYVVIKLDDNGAAQWASRYSGGNNDILNAIDLDRSGNIFVTGKTVGFNSSTTATVKFNPSGTQLWARSYSFGTNLENEAFDISIDSSGNSYICGYNEITNSPNGNYRSIIIKYDPAGVQKYFSEINGFSNTVNKATNIIVNQEGTKIYVTGTQNPSDNEYYTFTTRFGTNIGLNLTIIPEGFYSLQTNRLNMKDTVKVYLRNTTAPFAVIDSSKSRIDSVNFKGLFYFNTTGSGTYYLDCRHRNSIETWSKTGIALVKGGETNYDFTTAATQAYGDNLALKGSKYCVYSGDADQNGIVNLSDITIVHNDVSTFTTGYVRSDVNGDRRATLSDILIVYNNSSNLILVKKP